MPGLSKLKVAELRELCNKAGLNCTGLKKAELIALLREYGVTNGQANSADHSDNEGESDEEEEEVIIPGRGSQASDAPAAASSQQQAAAAAAFEANPEDPSILALKLKLQIAQIELEKAKLELGNGTRVAEAHPPRDLKSILPRMTSDDNSEAISFFHAFELSLQMNDVKNKTEWSRYLPACLSARAARVYSQLSLAESKDYEFVKKQILQNYRLTASAYMAKFKNSKRQGQESYRLFLGRLREFHTYWMESRSVDSLEKSIEQDILEQFLTTLPPT